MKIKNSIITLSDNKKYLVLTAEKLDDIIFGLISTLTEPKELKIVELESTDKSLIVKPYTGGDYQYILERLIKRAANEHASK